MKIGLAGLALVAMAGCRIKSVDSYLTSTTPDVPSAPVNDPYSFGGVAYASGGLTPQMSYGTGARGEFDGAPEYFTKMSRISGNKIPIWTVEEDPANEKSGQFMPPTFGRVKDTPASPFGTLEGY